jgi:hypothetical protein
MGAFDIISVVQSNGSVIGAVSLVLSISAIVFTIYSSRRSLINQNSWQTYELYNSDELRRGRAVARALSTRPGWQSVRDYPSYRGFFHMDEPEGPGPGDPIRAAHQEDQALHYLLNYYHQVGMLLQRGLLDRDFTMELVGEGLRDRWAEISRIPTFYGDTAYQGMFELYEAFKRWERSRRRGSRRNASRASAVVPSIPGEPARVALERRVLTRSK